MIKQIEQWFKDNYTYDKEEYNSSIVTYQGNNRFRLEIPITGEIKEMIIPINHFEEFKELELKTNELDNKMSKIYDEIYNKCTFEYEIEEALQTNEEYQNMNTEYDNLVNRIQVLQHEI